MLAHALALVAVAGALEFRNPRLTVSDAPAPSLLLREPLIPGTGVDNSLSWADAGIEEAPARAQIETAAWKALVDYLGRAPGVDVDRAELGPPHVTVHDGGQLVQIHVPRVFGGIPVRDSALVAVINHGNLVLLGTSRWGDRPKPGALVHDAAAAQRVVTAHLGGRALMGPAPRLEYVALANEPPAPGYRFRLVWVLTGRLAGDDATWEGLVDTGSGELLAFEDRNLYATTTKIVGGVYPLANDGLPPDGIEQSGYPLPFADVSLANGSSSFANSSGVAGCLGDGPGSPGRRFFRTTLAGRYVTIADACGPVRERWLAGSEVAGDLESGPGTNCTVPPGHSAGDTHAARTAFYELNRIAEQARGHLPGNSWLQAPVTATVNFNASCGASWSGSALVFYRSGGICRNVGEIAGVMDHEWGHGMDDNGANPTISIPTESLADIHASLHLGESCIGRGFFTQQNCSGYGDACTACTGVRDVDWAQHVSGLPHDVAWVQSRCPSGTSVCIREEHCAAIPVAESLWDLHARDLPAQLGTDAHTALEVATRLAYLGGGLVGVWYQCTPPSGGCGATGGYLNLLAADDDNGNLADGTPHATAIFAAFNRHQIACATPAPVNSGCAGGPAIAPVLTATPQDQRVDLAWTAVAGATRYAVFRADGVRGCDVGKAKLGETTGTSFTDAGLLNGFNYYYTVLPLAANSSCFGPMSACQPAVPAGSGACTP